MFKSVSLLIAGMALGAGTVFMFVRADSADTEGRSSNALLAGTDRAVGRREAPEVLSVSDTLAVYRAASAASDLVAIQNALERAASQSRSPARDVEIDALMARMSELAPARAVIVAVALGLELDFVAGAFVNWARVDPDAALAELANIDNSVAKREISLALLDVFGDDQSGFDRIADAMTANERESLQVEWLGRRAGFDPVGAFRDALRLFDTDMQHRALLRIGGAWVEQDPISALSQADLLTDPLRSSYRAYVFSEWARLDGAGYLAWLQSVGTPPEEAAAGIRYLTISDPERMIGVIDTLTGAVGRTIRMAALQSLAEIDPAAAMARASSLPPGSDRDTMLMATAVSLARTDPDAALAWAQELSPPSPIAVQQVAMAIAQSNPERAFDLLDNPPEGIDPNLIASLMVSVVSRDPDQAEVLANQLIVRDSIQDRNALRNLIGNWMQQDPERALEWILVHDEQVNAGVLGNAAEALARSDAVAAAKYADRIPAEYRSAWVTQVAVPYARNDPAAALAWVTTFQGQEYYDAALRGVITGSAQVEPRRAADLLSQAGPEIALGAAGPVVAVWANSDPGGAERWTLDLQRGQVRDQALNALIAQQAASGDFDRGLLSAFSSEAATQDALRRVIPTLSRSDSDAAEELLGQVTNAAVRRQLDEQITTMNAGR